MKNTGGQNYLCSKLRRERIIEDENIWLIVDKQNIGESVI